MIGVGVVPRDELARTDTAIAVDNGIIVNEYGQTTHPWVYAAGDVANHAYRYGAPRGRTEHWTVAAEQGRAAGRSLAGTPTSWTATPYFWSEQFEHTVHVFGRPAADATVITRSVTPSAACWLWVDAEHRVVAVAAIDTPADVRAARQLISSGALIDPLLAADPAVDLRDAKRAG